MPVRLKDSPKKQRSRLQFAAWLGNISALIIIADNDIYLKQSPSDEEDIRLTFSGESDLIYNGITDFLYQGKCDHFSRHSRHIRKLLAELHFNNGNQKS
jgi:inactive dipeptidyl peptidase 10